MMTAVAACGGDSSDNLTGAGVGSSFTATLTGGSAGSYSGISSAVPSAGLFSIGMATTDGKFAIAFTRNGLGPAVGTYPLGTNPDAGFTARMNINSGQIFYSSTSGTLTITSASSTEIQGSFAFTGTVTSGTGAVSNVTGSFTAACPLGC